MSVGALFYAVYGGHASVVRLLLANGAMADPETFIGERCVYGALNDEIRALLKEHNATDFSTRAKHPFARFLATLAFKKTKLHDVRFYFVDDELDFSGSRVILGARSETLRERFMGPWKDESDIKLSSKKASPRATVAVLSYVATGRLVVDVDDVKDARKLAMVLKLSDDVIYFLTMKEAEEEAFADHQDDGKQNPPDHDDQREKKRAPSLKKTKKVVVFEEPVSVLRASLEPFAESVSSKLKRDFVSASCDLSLECSDGSVDVPSVFLRAHSDVVDAAFNFHEAETRIFHMRDVPCAAAAALIRWCVCGSCAGAFDLSLAADLLSAAHRLLMPVDLMAAAGSALADALITEDDAIVALEALPYADLLEQEHGLERLYQTICKICAKNLDACLLNSSTFRTAVLQSADSIKNRQDTDSIILVDDIRAQIHLLFNPFDIDDVTPETMQEATKLNLIDTLLDDLGLDG